MVESGPSPLVTGCQVSVIASGVPLIVLVRIVG